MLRSTGETLRPGSAALPVVIGIAIRKETNSPATESFITAAMQVKTKGLTGGVLPCRPFLSVRSQGFLRLDKSAFLLFR